MTPDKLIAIRDVHGFRPLSLGKRQQVLSWLRNHVPLILWELNLFAMSNPGNGRNRQKRPAIQSSTPKRINSHVCL